MKELEGSEPIYIQIGNWLENEILSGRVNPEEKIYSQYKLSEIFGINPATALKGLNLLVEKKIVYKKRGLGMFVSSDALIILKKEHKNKVLTEQLRRLVREAKLLDVSKKELIQMLTEEMEKSSNSTGKNNLKDTIQNRSIKEDDRNDSLQTTDKKF